MKETLAICLPGFKTFLVLRDEERTRLDDVEDLLGWGVRFPDSGECLVEWRRDAFPEEDRLDHPHVSRYGSLDDVEQGTGGTVARVDSPFRVLEVSP